jgi:hypothetical protein
MPLACDDNPKESKDQLLLHRSELRLAREAGVLRERRVDSYPITKTQVGFLQVALLRALNTVEGADRPQWIADYKAISTGVDAAIFMTEAKLKVMHGIDVKKLDRLAAAELRNQASSSTR